MMDLKENLVQLIRKLHEKGHSPATSTNYSFKDNNNQIWITRSGLDKGIINPMDFIGVDPLGKPLVVSNVPSAETRIHCEIYNLFKEAKVVLHSHAIFPVLLSSILSDRMQFKDYEIQKGFKGVKTHLEAIDIPIFDNSQDMEDVVHEMRSRMEELKFFSLVLRKHGVYVWGANLLEAKRHLETLDYLCECEFKLRSQWPS